MNFINAVKSYFVKWNDFKTRSSRSEYWWATLFSTLASIVSQLVNAAIASNPSALTLTIAILVLILLIFMFIASLALVVRRLHDLDKDGKILIPYIFVDLIGWIDLFYKLDTELILILDFIWYVLFVYFIIIFMFKGSNKKNRYGKPIKL